jgi:hypothetical protein
MPAAAPPEKEKEDMQEAVEEGGGSLSCRRKSDEPSAVESALELTLCGIVGDGTAEGPSPYSVTPVLATTPFLASFSIKLVQFLLFLLASSERKYCTYNLHLRPKL